MEKFHTIYSRAAQRKGSEAMLTLLLSQPKSHRQLVETPSSEILSEMSKKVFQSGFVWRVVRNKWPDFEEVFWHFDINKLMMMPDDMLEKKAFMLHDIVQAHGSVGQWLADWPAEDTIGLWAYLKQHGARLGGNTGPYALRAVGKDTFILSRDIEAYFRAHKLIDGGLNSKRSLSTIQNAFNQWRKESGLSLQEISQTIAYATGDNVAGMA